MSRTSCIGSASGGLATILRSERDAHADTGCSAASLLLRNPRACLMAAQTSSRRNARTSGSPFHGQCSAASARRLRRKLPYMLGGCCSAVSSASCASASVKSSSARCFHCASGGVPPPASSPAAPASAVTAAGSSGSERRRRRAAGAVACDVAGSLTTDASLLRMSAVMSFADGLCVRPAFDDDDEGSNIDPRRESIISSWSRLSRSFLSAFGPASRRHTTSSIKETIASRVGHGAPSAAASQRFCVAVQPAATPARAPPSPYPSSSEDDDASSQRVYSTSYTLACSASAARRSVS
mmetsp:Transcript_773/g.2795  ORF Transcript_773/g.2795 Transcript_773/m.2795 type:complete len:296 (-) Transcript_773:108-995(-)